MAQDGLAAFEPAFVDELAVVLAWGFEHLQRVDLDEDGEGGGSVYLRLSTRPVEQITRTMSPELRCDVIAGGYWLRRPGPNCQVAVAYTGAVAPEAIEAVGLMAEDRRDVGLLAVTSADRLHAGWTAAQRAREAGDLRGPLACGTPARGRAAAMWIGYRSRRPPGDAWLGLDPCTVTAFRPLGVEHFGQTGSISELYRHYGLDASAIMTAARDAHAWASDPASAHGEVGCVSRAQRSTK